MGGDDRLDNVGGNQLVHILTEAPELVINAAAPGKTPRYAEFRLAVGIDDGLGEDLLTPGADFLHAGNAARQEKKLGKLFPDALADLTQARTEDRTEGPAV